ncbi:MAG TPA: DMT family transporter [Pirellulales bacterium]|jgi:drug/metabolite transporter (DMT)-like permease|nr:DMT family transporter [Pirellulales bacterium]
MRYDRLRALLFCEPLPINRAIAEGLFEYALIPNAVLPYAWMLFGALAFAVMGSLAHALGPSCHWLVVALTRTGLALGFTTVLARAAGVKLVFWRPATLWVRSIAGSISLVCTFFALTHLPVAEVLTLTNVFPIWVAILSWPLYGERPSWETCVAIAIGLAGVVLVQQPHFTPGEFSDGHEITPALLALCSSVTTAVAMLGLHRLQEIDPRAIVVHFSGVALSVCLVLVLVMPGEPIASSHFGSTALVMLLGVGIAATIGQLFLTKAFAAGPPAKVSVVALTQAVFAMAFDVLVTGHTFGSVTLAGMVLVMAPTAWLLLSQGRGQVDDL